MRRKGLRPISGFGRAGRAAALALALAAGAAGAGEMPGEAPARVVSLNLCTDQLAMLLAAPGQFVAVSHLARDPLSSPMAEEAMAYPVTRGQAEEVFLLGPDLVLAGTYTTRATVELLRRLGLRVEEFPPPVSLADVGVQMRAVAAVLGRAEAGARMAEAFEAGLAALRAEPGPRAALYDASGYTGGEHTLAGEILAAAGFRNVASEVGLEAGGFLPLELLILAAPDAVVTGETYPGASRAEEILAHPALRGLSRAGAVSDADWVCGTPHLLGAIARLGAAREALGQ
ncbi:MAG: ABC transporter substrate-binding protein [Paracoccaceae bacterium]|nr:ABC transporter substrate-binding protein [Paracoccaceae bacterium]